MINRRIVFSYKPDIAMQFLPHFVVRKCPEDFPKPPAMYGHYAYFLDFESQQVTKKLGVTEHSYSLSEKPKIEDYKLFPIPDHLAQLDENQSVMDELIFLINAITDHVVFQYGSRQGWFITLDGEHQSFYGQEGYNSPDYDSTLDSFEDFKNYEMTELPVIMFNNAQGENVKSYKLGDIFGLYFNSNDVEFKKSYINACIVLTKAFKLREVDWSASYVFLVAAIEALIEIEYHGVKPIICDSCKMPHYSVRQKFIGFLDKYGYNIDKKTKDLFSGIRNGIVHKGKLLGMSYSHKWTIENQEDLDAMYFSTMDRLNYDSFHHLVMTCFRTFLIINLDSRT